MKEYTIHYVEVVHHEFSFDATSREDAERLYEYERDNGFLDYSDGYIENSLEDISEPDGPQVNSEELVREMYDFPNKKIYEYIERKLIKAAGLLEEALFEKYTREGMDEQEADKRASEEAAERLDMSIGEYSDVWHGEVESAYARA